MRRWHVDILITFLVSPSLCRSPFTLQSHTYPIHIWKLTQEDHQSATTMYLVLSTHLPHAIKLNSQHKTAFSCFRCVCVRYLSKYSSLGNEQLLATLFNYLTNRTKWDKCDVCIKHLPIHWEVELFLNDFGSEFMHSFNHFTENITKSCAVHIESPINLLNDTIFLISKVVNTIEHFVFSSPYFFVPAHQKSNLGNFIRCSEWIFIFLSVGPNSIRSPPPSYPNWITPQFHNSLVMLWFQLFNLWFINFPLFRRNISISQMLRVPGNTQMMNFFNKKKCQKKTNARVSIEKFIELYISAFVTRNICIQRSFSPNANLRTALNTNSY